MLSPRAVSLLIVLAVMVVIVWGGLFLGQRLRSHWMDRFRLPAQISEAHGPQDPAAGLMDKLAAVQGTFRAGYANYPFEINGFDVLQSAACRRHWRKAYAREKSCRGT